MKAFEKIDDLDLKQSGKFTFGARRRLLLASQRASQIRLGQSSKQDKESSVRMVIHADKKARRAKVRCACPRMPWWNDARLPSTAAPDCPSSSQTHSLRDRSKTQKRIAAIQRNASQKGPSSLELPPTALPGPPGHESGPADEPSLQLPGSVGGRIEEPV